MRIRGNRDTRVAKRTGLPPTPLPRRQLYPRSPNRSLREFYVQFRARRRSMQGLRL